MFFLKKVFELRDNANPEAEKPFLDHLEDLRITITRILITLIISTLFCFTYRNELMELIKRPIEEVWVMKHQATLPSDVTLDDWERALSFANTTPVFEKLHPGAADAWWAELPDSDKLRPLTQAAVIYRALDALPPDRRLPFLEKIPDLEPEIRRLSANLVESAPAADLNASGNLRLMSALRPTETFMLSMKLAFFAGIVIAFPLLLYFILQFVVPGLKDEERKALWPALAVGFGLFLIGVLFAYFVVLPRMLGFFYDWSGDLGISNDWRIGYYISFATQFVLIFGFAFELPVVIMTLVHLGILSHTMMKETRSYAIVAILVIAAVITPTPDIMTLLFLALPMLILYELCIWLSYFKEKKDRACEEAEEEEFMRRLLDDPEDEFNDLDSAHDDLVYDGDLIDDDAPEPDKNDREEDQNGPHHP